MNPYSLLHMPAELLRGAEPQRGGAGPTRVWRCGVSLVVLAGFGAVLAAALLG